MSAQPFHIHVEQRVLDDLQMRFLRTRRPSVVTNAITRSPVLSVIYDRRIDSPRDLNDLPI